MEYYNAFDYCRTFNCSLDEYERRPFKETQWMLAMKSAYDEAVQMANEKAQQDASMRQ